MKDYIQMTGRHVLVTGGTSGIGRATAIILSELGAKVCIVGRREEALRETLSMMSGEGHSMYAADLSKIEEIEGLLKQIVATHGAFDGVVHSAGMVENLPLAHFKFERLHKTMLTNFYSFFEIVRVLTRKGRYNNGLSIVAISSVSVYVGAPAQAAYAASKAAINGAMRSLAKELSDKCCRMNVVIAGPTNTDMYSRCLDLRADMQEKDPTFKPRYYLGMNEPEDVANAAIWLLSPVSQKVTGIELAVDGGYTAN